MCSSRTRRCASNTPTQQTAGGAQQANNQQVLTGVVGTVLGAGLGAAVGGGQGAAIGAGAGAVAGTAYGATPAQYAQMNLQQRVHPTRNACTHGDQVPGYQPAPPPRLLQYPPPPPGYPPPGYAPPPGYPPPPGYYR